MVTCPKCSWQGTGAADDRLDACPRCGLARRFWDRFSATPPSEALDAAWRACVAAWAEARRHDLCLDVAGNGGELGLLARNYRQHLAAHPDDAVAPRQLLRIGVLVETAARAQARSASLGGRALRVAWAVGYALAGLLLCGSGYILYRVFTHH